MKSTYLSLLVATLLALVQGREKWLDDYVSKPEEVYSWYHVDNENSTYETIMGGTAYTLNVTSIKWLDTTKASGPQGDVWSHLATVIVPKNLLVSNVSVSWITGSCNQNPNEIPGKYDPDIIVTDQMSAAMGVIAVAIKQIPNCPIVFPSDPEQKQRHEDAIIAWTWKEFIDRDDHDPEWLLHVPMTKASMQVMKASQDFINNKLPAVASHNEQVQDVNITSWIPSGGSKRGWTTWMVGAVNCSTCVKILAMVPIVPIVPPLDEEIHYQWQSYGGFTFMFRDYFAAGNLQHIDDPVWQNATYVIDPLYYNDTLVNIPKYVIVGSNDEFMQFDWTHLWYGKVPGETHLQITSNTEHSQVTGIFKVLAATATFCRSVIYQRPRENRPSFNYTLDTENQTLDIWIPDHLLNNVDSVRIRYAQTLQTERRDFRWMRQINDQTGPCKLPSFPLKKKNNVCFQTIFWRIQKMEQVETGHWKGSIPQPQKHFWMGFYGQIKMRGDLPPSGQGILGDKYLVTTPGWVTPDVMPYPPCEGAGCTNTPV